MTTVVIITTVISTALIRFDFKLSILTCPLMTYNVLILRPIHVYYNTTNYIILK